MGYPSVYDTYDPWAFRNTWTGEIRNSYEDLWIWITLIVGVTFIALCALVPIMLHIYCRDACYCAVWCRCFERFLSVCHTMSWEHQEESRKRQSLQKTRSKGSEEMNIRMEYDLNVPFKLDHPPGSHRSYPHCFYPRSITLPPRQHRTMKTRFHSMNRRRSRSTTIQRSRLPMK